MVRKENPMDLKPDLWIPAMVSGGGLLLTIIGLAVVWGKLTAQFEGVRTRVDQMSHVIYPEPHKSGSKLLTADDCKDCKANLSRLITALETKFDQKLDSIEKKREIAAEKYDSRWSAIEVYMKSIDVKLTEKGVS